jgi:hypothetical protein
MDDIELADWWLCQGLSITYEYSKGLMPCAACKI